MTTVCSVGLDMIAVPGDTSAVTLTGQIADERTIGMVNGKTTAVRVIPIPGRGPGEMHDWGGLLGTAIVQDPGRFSCEVLWRRGGRIPAPMESTRNRDSCFPWWRGGLPGNRGEGASTIFGDSAAEPACVSAVQPETLLGAGRLQTLTSLLAMVPTSSHRTVVAFLAQCASFAVTLSVAGAQVGTNYCTPAANSTGVAATISGSGSAEVVLNNLTLTSSNLPLNAAAYFLCSRDQGFVSNPGGSLGHLCLGNTIGRRVGGLVRNSGTSGMVSVLADLTAMPQPGGAVVVQVAETWNFQCWYRDTLFGIPTSGFSDGLHVLFTGSGGPNLIPGMMPIPAGTFMMGSNAPNGPPYFGEYTPDPVRQVTISYPFWMGQYEVTQAEFRALTGWNSSSVPGDTRPVDLVSWSSARAYCTLLTAQQAGNLPAGYEYRLPTEAEWEYACRAGTTTEYHYGPDLFCNQALFDFSYHSNPPSPCGFPTFSMPVGRYAPNAFGLYDMHGNVWEMCLDSYAPYSSAPVTDPFVTGGLQRVHRGGSWEYNSVACRSAHRRGGDYGSDVGFRVVLAPVLVP